MLQLLEKFVSVNHNQSSSSRCQFNPSDCLLEISENDTDVVLHLLCRREIKAPRHTFPFRKILNAVCDYGEIIMLLMVFVRDCSRFGILINKFRNELVLQNTLRNIYVYTYVCV